MGCGASRDYTVDIEKLDQCQTLINEILSIQQQIVGEYPDHDMFDNTQYTMWSAKVQRLVLLLRGESDKKQEDLKKNKRQVTLAADELENLVKWIDKARYEMAKTNNVWLEDSELDFIQTMKGTFITELNRIRKYKANLGKPAPAAQPAQPVYVTSPVFAAHPGQVMQPVPAAQPAPATEPVKTA